jgi:hypothetical protein
VLGVSAMLSSLQAVCVLTQEVGAQLRLHTVMLCAVANRVIRQQQPCLASLL